MCDPDLLLNGGYIVGEGMNMADYNTNAQVTGRYNGYYVTDIREDGAAFGSYNNNAGKLNLGTGIFKTNNASVFEGEYLVYYPYTNAFTKGEIIAELPTTYNIDANLDRYAAASETAFNIGYLKHYQGGSSSAKLTSKMLNGFAIMKLYNYAETTAPANKNITKVILYSKKGDILYSQSLKADACVKALSVDKTLGAGTQLYGSKSAYTNTIVANLNHDIIGTNVEPTEDSHFVWVAIPVLPQTVDDLEIVLVDNNDKTCRIPVGSQAFTSWKANLNEKINVNEYEFKAEYMVTDEASLWSAWNKINLNGDADGNKIIVMNDIRLDSLGIENGSGNTDYVNSNIHNAWFYNKGIEITTECETKPVITLASEQLMSIKSQCAFTQDYQPTLTFNVPVVIEGAECCEAQPAALIVGGTSEGDYNIVFNEKVTNNGTLAIANNHQDNGKTRNVTFAELENAYDAYALQREKTAGAAQLYLLGNNSNINITKLVNKGNVKSVATSINLDKLFGSNEWPAVLNEPLFSTIVSNGKRVAQTTVGTLINSSTEGVESGLIEIEQYTLINVDTELKNEDAKAIIKIKGDSHSTYDGRLDVKGKSSNKGVMDNTGVVNFTKQSLDNDGLFIDRQSGQVGGKMVDNGTSTEDYVIKEYEGMTYKTDLKTAGIYVAQVETVDRMSVVLGDAVVEPSTVIVEILGCDASFYNLEDFEKNLNDKDVIINAEKQIAFKSFDKSSNSTASCFGHCVTVGVNRTLLVTDGILSTVKRVYVEPNATFNVRASLNGKETTVTVGGNLWNAGTVEHTADLLTIEKKLDNTLTGKFYSKNPLTVNGQVVTEGELDIDGTPNFVKKDFTQNGGTVTFATKTTTTIEGIFNCWSGKFEREGLNGTNQFRATVNVNQLGETNGTTDTAWPTQYGN